MKWADKIDPENVLGEYPRPLMVRDQWKNLNGLWNYSITPRFSGAVYTQITDVEIEVNGLLTYDRRKFKLDVDRIRLANLRLRGIFE